MKKEISYVLHGASIVAIAVLFYLYTSSKTCTSSEPVGEIESSEAPVSMSNQEIVYVNTDTLLLNYQYFKDKQLEMEKKRMNLDKILKQKAKSLENEMMNFRQTAASMMPSQAQVKEQELMQEQQKLMQLQQEYTQQVAMQEAAINDSLYNNVIDFFKEYSKGKNFKLVLSYAKGTGVLYAKDNMEVTNEVLAAMNEAYQAQDSVQTSN